MIQATVDMSGFDYGRFLYILVWVVVVTGYVSATIAASISENRLIRAVGLLMMALLITDFIYVVS